MLARHILDPELRERLETLCAKQGLELKDYICGQQTLDMALFYIQDDTQITANGLSIDDAARLREMAEEAPVIDFVNRVFSMALKDNASDIHIEPCLLYTSPSPRDATLSRMPSSA